MGTIQPNRSFLQMMEAELSVRAGIHCAYAKYCGQLTLEDLFTTDSVYMAACHCAVGFWSKRDTYTFMDSAWVNSMLLAKEVVSGKFKPSYYRERTILERGKPRVIKPPTFRCKVVQKVLCDLLLRPLLEPRMVSANYASVRGRGTSALHEDLLKGLNRYGEEGNVIVTTDFSGYFAGIDTEKLGALLGRYIRDPRIIRLFRKFCPEDFGLSLGNETSQIPASFFPSAIDHDLKDRQGYKVFARYMDDIQVLARSEADAERLLAEMANLAGRLGLTLKPEKIRRIPYGEDFVFCKEKYIYNREHHYYYRLPNPQAARNEVRKLKRFGKEIRSGTMAPEKAEAQYRSVIGSMAAHPNTWKTGQRLNALYEKETGQKAPEVSAFKRGRRYEGFRAGPAIKCGGGQIHPVSDDTAGNPGSPGLDHPGTKSAPVPEIFCHIKRKEGYTPVSTERGQDMPKKIHIRSPAGAEE